MNRPLLIYCAAGNRRLAEIAMRHGFAYGCPSNDTPAATPVFADLDYRRPDWPRHVEFCARWRPLLAVAGDAETPAQLEAVLRQAEELSAYAERVIVVPKASGLAAAVPSHYVLGLSVPTSFGGTTAAFWEFAGRPVHLLGGNPHAQMRMWRYLGWSVYSADGNSAQKAAVRWGIIWERGRWTTRERAVEIVGPGPDLPERAFDLSCRNIAAAWRELTGGRETDVRLREEVAV